MRTRREPAANYSSIFLNGKTLRIPIDKDKTITELRFPEFYDVAINSWCAGRCPYCYTSATTKGTHFKEIIEKIYSFFGEMDENQRPYQVALGGAGEPTAHPLFQQVLKTFRDLNIVPNYTTNGMHLSEKVLNWTKEYCGGVAITLHPHLEKFWRSGIEKLINNKIRTNIHLVISDKESIDRLSSLYTDYGDKIEYFVLLPYMNVGFASGDNARQIEFDYLEGFLDSIKDLDNVAFGSNFYDFLKRVKKYDVSLYPPEIMSKYLIMDDDMNIYNNSFECRKVDWVEGEGCKI
jgi:sulfatase maturation enzyme AslB (radical SAM superfamily)